MQKGRLILTIDIKFHWSTIMFLKEIGQSENKDVSTVAQRSELFSMDEEETDGEETDDEDHLKIWE